MHTNRHSPQSEGGAFVGLDWDLGRNPAKQALKRGEAQFVPVSVGSDVPINQGRIYKLAPNGKLLQWRRRACTGRVTVSCRAGQPRRPVGNYGDNPGHEGEAMAPMASPSLSATLF